MTDNRNSRPAVSPAATGRAATATGSQPVGTTGRKPRPKRVGNRSTVAATGSGRVPQPVGTTGHNRRATAAQPLPYLEQPVATTGTATGPQPVATRAAVVTGTDQAAPFDRLSRWVAGLTNGCAVVSVTITTGPQPQPLGSQPQPVQAVVVHTESNDGGADGTGPLDCAPAANRPSGGK